MQIYRRVAGLAEFWLSGGTEHKEGGFLGFGAKRITEEEYTAVGLLKRLVRALQNVGVSRLLNGWVGQTPIFESVDGSTVRLASAVRNCRERSVVAGDFVLTLVHEDIAFDYQITIDYKARHGSREPALTIQVTGDIKELFPTKGEASEAFERRIEELLPDKAKLGEFEEEHEGIMEDFLTRLANQVAKELGVEDFQVQAWIDRSGEFDADRALAADTGAAAATLGPPV